MNQETHPINDLGTLAEDARELLSATADVAGEKVGQARKRLAAALESGKAIAGCVRDTAVAGAKALKARGTTSIAAFNAAQAQLSGVYDELDAATTEINGALLEPGGNGEQATTSADVKNSSTA